MRAANGGAPTNASLPRSTKLFRYAPFLLKPAHDLFSQSDAGTGARALEPRDLSEPAHRAFQRDGIRACPTQRARIACARSWRRSARSSINTGFPIEFRTVAADDVWLSPFYRRASATIAVHQYHRVDTTRVVQRLRSDFPRIRRPSALGQAPYAHRPKLARLYPKFEDFRALRASSTREVSS